MISSGLRVSWSGRAAHRSLMPRSVSRFSCSRSAFTTASVIDWPVRAASARANSPAVAPQSPAIDRGVGLAVRAPPRLKLAEGLLRRISQR